MRKFIFSLLSRPCLLALLAGASCTNLPKVPPDDAVEALLARMTLEEKIGQVIQADIAAVTPEEVKRYNLGSVLNGGNSAPGGGKTAPPADWVALADDFWRASTDVTDGGVGIPVLWGTDAVHGHNNLQSATIFPHNIGLGAANDPILIEKIGEITAREIRATGLDWTFAPTLAVAQDDRWGRTYESYSENPEIVAAYSSAMVRGLQGTAGADDFLLHDHVIATAKHFIGDGGTQRGIDKGDTKMGTQELISLHGAGYLPAFNAGVQTVMASFSSVNGTKLHGSKELLTDILRDELGFQGFVLGDWNGHGEIPGCTPTNCPRALEAGIDMYMAPDSWRGLYQSLLSQAKSGALDLERLDEAVRRILTVKSAAGLFEAGLPSKRESTKLERLGAKPHRAVAREAVRKSLVLLKNNHSLLPLSPASTVGVAGSGADSMQQQTGGWTLSWQGNNNINSEFLTGETVFSGIKKAVSGNGGKAILSEDGSFEETPDAVIVVFGEHPYAEFKGDRSDLVFEFDNEENIALLKQFQDQNIPVVSVFLTGRPLWVSQHINASDAFVVGWLPGTEGGGIADILIADSAGAPRYDFTGALPFTWPATGGGAPINMADTPGTLFAFGYGLQYADTKHLAPVSEDSGIQSVSAVFTGDIIAQGEAVTPFSTFLGDASHANTPATGQPNQSINGSIATKGVDYKAQEDAQLISWNGADTAHFSIKSPRPVDVSTQAADDALAFVLTWRIDEAPDQPFLFSVRCGEQCAGELDISPLIATLPPDSWTTTALPVSCLISNGLNPASITVPLEFSTQGRAEIALHAARLEVYTGPLTPCPS